MPFQKRIRSLIIGVFIAIPTTYLCLGASLSGLNSTSFVQALSELPRHSQFMPTFALSFIIIVIGITVAGMLVGKSPNTAGPSINNASSTEIEGDREFGTVKWFNSSKGFGFITRDQGDDIFVHYRSIRGEGHRSLREGQNVDFVVTEGEKGLQAEDVIPAAK